MNLSLEEKTVRALGWIIEILNRHKIEYQISGGLAGKIFGSERELHDIDIDISKKYFNKILPDISDYIIYGPAHYKDAKSLDIDLNGIKIKVINPKNFIEYKKELDGTHQLEDIETAKKYCQ